jgi:hypothetical protein
MELSRAPDDADPPFPPYLDEDFPPPPKSEATWIPKPSGIVGNGYRAALCKLPA